MRALKIGLIGDFNETVTAHRAIPVALRLAGEALGRTVDFDWLATDAMPDAQGLSSFDALWCVPGSPYRDMPAALRAIRFAREQRVPFLGTCGGFQHAVIEFARDGLGIADAEHAETSPEAPNAVISALACALVEVSDQVTLVPGSRIQAAYGSETATEGYHCRYGLNPAFAARLLSGPLRATAQDSQGEIRAIELDDHPFFVCTLFQPERAALKDVAPPLVLALLRAAAAR
jgi:CTP synthase (UTP-ammonia lyase)